MQLKAIGELLSDLIERLGWVVGLSDPLGDEDSGEWEEFYSYADDARQPKYEITYGDE